MRPRHAHVVLLGTLVLSLLVAGCGAASRSPGVASLGAPGATDSPTRGAPPGSTPSASPGVDNGGQAILIGGGGGLKFSQCMRAHGVANFPDPNGQGVTQFGPTSGINPQSATFQSAAQACRSAVRGKAPQLSPAQQAKARRQVLAFSTCMRKHGIPDFPDPTFGADGNAAIHLSGPPSSDLNANNPTFQAALQGCHGFKLGGKKGPGSFRRGGLK
jgi:hypothetical protein